MHSGTILAGNTLETCSLSGGDDSCNRQSKTPLFLVSSCTFLQSSLGWVDYVDQPHFSAENNLVQWPLAISLEYFLQATTGGPELYREVWMLDLCLSCRPSAIGHMPANDLL